MTPLHLSVGEPFTSPAWGSNFVVFSSLNGDLIPEDSVKEYLAKSCRYAKHYKVYLVPERFHLMDYHSMCLISPEGKVVGAQKALYLNLAWRQGKRSTQLDILQTEFGAMSLCVDVDIYHPEIPRLVQSMGGQYIVSSQFIQMGDYNTGMVTTGVWSAAQSCALYVIGASNQFNCVCAPRRMTENDDGFLVTPRQKTPLTAKLQAEELARLPQRELLSRKFYSVHRNDLLL
jgi:hypothetical protein